MKENNNSNDEKSLLTKSISGSSEENNSKVHYIGAVHSNREKVKYYKNKKRKKRIIISLISIFLILIIALIGTFLVCYNMGKKQLFAKGNITDINGNKVEGNIIKYKGHTYKYNENITSILFMGIDRDNFNNDKLFGANGQSDAVFVLAVDTETGLSKSIAISRDTMVEANKYTEKGRFLGKEKMQLCLSFSYGDGKKLSCENVKTSVSDLLYGIPMNSYVAIDLTSLGILNNAVGGVAVTSNETFNNKVYYFEKGKSVFLTEQPQVEYYLRHRDISKLDSNQLRIERLKEYITNYSDKLLKRTSDNIMFPAKVYRSVKDYRIDNLTVPKITYLARTILKVKNVNIEFSSIEGKVKEGKPINGRKYAEFYPNETKLFELVLSIYYNRID